MTSNDVLKQTAKNDAELLNVLKTNLLAHMVFHLTYHTDGSVSFEEVTDFHIHNKYVKMKRDEQNLYDLFNSFRNTTNATKTLVEVVGMDKPIVTIDFINELKKKQAKFKPTLIRTETTKDEEGKDVITETEINLNQLNSYKEFEAVLTQEEKESLYAIANQVMTLMFRDVNSFENFHRVTKDFAPEVGDTLIAYDSNNQIVGYKVFQANERGFVYGADHEGHFVATASMGSKRPAEGIVPKEFETMFSENLSKVTEDMEDYKQERLDMAAKAADIQAAKVEKIEKRKLASEKRKEAAEAEKAEKAANLQTILDAKLTTAAAIAKATKQATELAMTNKQREEARKFIKLAKTALSPKKKDEAATSSITDESDDALTKAAKAAKAKAAKAAKAKKAKLAKEAALEATKA